MEAQERACKDPTERRRPAGSARGREASPVDCSGERADGPDEGRERVLDQIKYRSINLQLLLGRRTSLESFEQRCDVT